MRFLDFVRVYELQFINNFHFTLLDLSYVQQLPTSLHQLCHVGLPHDNHDQHVPQAEVVTPDDNVNIMNHNAKNVSSQSQSAQNFLRQL